MSYSLGQTTSELFRLRRCLRTSSPNLLKRVLVVRMPPAPLRQFVHVRLGLVARHVNPKTVGAQSACVYANDAAPVRAQEPFVGVLTQLVDFEVDLVFIDDKRYRLDKPRRTALVRKMKVC